MERASAPALGRLRTAEDVPAELARLGVRTGRAVTVLVGGAGGMSDDAVSTLDTLLREIVLPVLDGCGGAVVDGGTDSGVMRAIGRARAATGAVADLVGVAAEGTARVPGAAAPPIDDAADLEPHHDAVLLVPGREWGAEAAWISLVATSLAGSSPSVTLLVNGGRIAYDDVRHSLDAGRPVLVLSGTGRTADAIATAVARTGSTTTDARAVAIAASPSVSVVAVDDTAGLRSALITALS